MSVTNFVATIDTIGTSVSKCDSVGLFVIKGGLIYDWLNPDASTGIFVDSIYSSVSGTYRARVDSVQHYGWPDVAAASAVGLAVGASIEGAGIGLAVGAVTGLLLWQLHPSVGPGGAVAATGSNCEGAS